MEKKISNKRILLAALFMFLFLCTFIFLLSMLNNRDIKSTELRNGFNVTINDENFTNVDLRKFNFPSVGTGDVITLARTLPTEETESPVLQFFTRNSAATVSVGGKEVYQYGMERYEQELLVASSSHWLNLSPDSYGKELVITLYVNEPKAFTHIKCPEISSGDTIDNNVVSHNFLNLCASLFLLMFGACIIAISIFMMILYPGFSQLLYTGLFSICIGLWAFCNKGCIQLVSSDIALNQTLESFSLYLGSIPVILFVRSLRPKDRRRINAPNILLCANVALLAITVILHISNLVHHVVLLPAYHALYTLIILYIVISCIRHISKGNGQEKVLLTGICILALSVACDIILFRTARYSNAVPDDSIGATVWGGILFVICMIISYGGRIYRDVYSRLEKEALMNLAYSDNLTKISNRAKFMEKIEELEADSAIYSIISFDLNNLKLINDRLGHANGDLLLQTFAKVLHKSFSSHGTVARMGGDEFSVLIQDNRIEILDKLIQNYQEILKDENEKGYSFQISAAYGIANNTENGRMTFQEVFALADKRMYFTKSDMKKSAPRN